MTVSVSDTRPVQAVPQLTRYGLSVHADLVYRFLRLLGAASPGVVARELELSRRQTMAALDELTEYAAVSHVAAQDLWQAGPPDAFLPALRERRARLAAARREMRRNLSILDIVGVPLERLAGAWPLREVSTARRRYEDLVAGAATELLSMNPEAAFTRDSARTGIPASLGALRRGARSLNLGVPAAEEDESGTYASQLRAYDRHEYRELHRQPVKLTVVDREIAFFPIDPSRNFHGGVWEISDPSIVDELASFFLGRWEVAVAPTAGWRPPQGLSGRERAVLVALAEGDTDEMAAERLQISSRTVRYVIRELMDRYHVKTRFQLGLVVAHLTEGEQE